MSKKTVIQKGFNNPLKITRDSSANVKLLKKLENKGLIKIFDVMLENGRENRKIKEKILPIGVWGHSRWDECVWGDEDNKYDEILHLIGRQNIKDAMHLETHLRSENDYFVTQDKDDILSKRDELLKQFGIKAVSPEELQLILNKEIEDDEHVPIFRGVRKCQ